ncbi:putative ribosome-binding factor A, mitochondrial [Rhynchocyon petersi]
MAHALWALHAGLRALLNGCGAGRILLLDRPRGLHGSPVSCGSKNLLKKFASKSKKKFWYDSPSLGSHLKTYKPSKLELLLKTTSKKTKKEDRVRLRALNGHLYKALTDLLCTPEVSPEVYILNVELSKVSLTSDFSACRVYWKTPLSTEQREHACAVLQRSAAHLRHQLISQQTLRNVPPLVFVEDRETAALAEIDQLLAVADFGPPDRRQDMMGRAISEPQDLPPPSGATQPAELPCLYEIDHEVLRKQIMEYKRKRGKELVDVNLRPQDRVQEQLAELARQMKRKKKKAKTPDHGAAPESCMLGRESEDGWDYDDLEWLQDSLDCGQHKGGSGEQQSRTFLATGELPLQADIEPVLTSCTGWAIPASLSLTTNLPSLTESVELAPLKPRVATPSSVGTSSVPT